MLKIVRRDYGIDYYWNSYCFLTSAPRYVVFNTHGKALILGLFYKRPFIMLDGAKVI